MACSAGCILIGVCRPDDPNDNVSFYAPVRCPMFSLDGTLMSVYVGKKFQAPGVYVRHIDSQNNAITLDISGHFVPEDPHISVRWHFD